jgi:PAS domain S-box-containing protein
MAKESDRKYVGKAKKRLIKELEALYKHVGELENTVGGGEWIDEALLERKLVRSAAIEEMPDGVMLVDTSGKVVHVNKSLERLLGYKANELIGISALELPTYRGERDREKAKEALKEVLEKGSAEHIDIGAITKSGEEIAINFAASVIRDAQGAPKTLVAVMRDITKRKRAEEALKKREENFRVLIDNSMDISLVTNADLTVRYVSPSVERVLGYKPEEIIGRNAFEFLSPEDIDNITRNFDILAENPGRPVALEVHFLHKDGVRRVIDSITNNLLNDPTVLGFVVNARDITERKRTEEALKEREEHFRALIENSLDGIAIVNSDLTILYESPSAERIVGYKLEELIGRSILDFIHQDDRENVIKTFKKLARHPAQAVPASIRFLHKDGTWHVMEGSANNLLNNPAVKGIVVNYRDVTERQRAQEALKQREEHFRVMIDNSLDNVVILDGEGAILYESPSIERVLGYKREDFEGKTTFEFVHPDDLARVTRAFTRVVKNPGSASKGEVRAPHVDGSWRTLEVIVRNFLDDTLVGGILINFRDITERKIAEEERVQHATALARAEELQLSLQRIVTAQESVRRDIAQQLHGSVQNRLIILLHRLAELERKAPLGELAQELGDLRQKLEDLLDNQVRPISHRLYPSILRRGLIAALQSLADQFEVSLEIEREFDEELTRREKSAPQLIQEHVRLAAYRIAEEALTNVVKHTKASKVNIKLRLLPEEWLCLMLRDDGQGFDLAGGSGGRGLMMMQDYAEVVGGRCIIQSAPGEGTEVTALLPFSEPGANRPEKALPLEQMLAHPLLPSVSHRHAPGDQ